MILSEALGDPVDYGRTTIGNGLQPGDTDGESILIVAEGNVRGFETENPVEVVGNLPPHV